MQNAQQDRNAARNDVNNPRNVKIAELKAKLAKGTAISDADLDSLNS